MDDFFKKQTNSSRIKASIIAEYFPQYCRIITKKNKPITINYVDLFSGPGFYDDGSPSTPILIARQCAKDHYLKKNVKFIFNDNEYGDKLENNFTAEFPKGTFANAPHFGKSTVGENAKITEFLTKNTHSKGINEHPSLLFIDPFGYKGIETKVLAEFLKNWGNEIFIFLNTKRIHPALVNDRFTGLMQDLLPTTFDQVKNDRKFKSTVPERLNLIIESIGKEYECILKSKIFFTAFRFQEEDSDATSHYILHLTKSARGFDLVKTIYNDFANVGTVFDGVSTYTFDVKSLDSQQAELFNIKDMNIDKLKEILYTTFKGKEANALDLYDSTQAGHLYSRSHYTAALRSLVDENKVEAKFTDGKNHKVTVLISKDCILKFK